MWNAHLEVEIVPYSRRNRSHQAAVNVGTKSAKMLKKSIENPYINVKKKTQGLWKQGFWGFTVFFFLWGRGGVKYKKKKTFHWRLKSPSHGTYYCWWLKSGVHQLRLVVYPIIYKGFIHPNGGWEWDFWTINSITKKKQEFLLEQPTESLTFLHPDTWSLGFPLKMFLLETHHVEVPSWTLGGYVCICIFILCEIICIYIYKLSIYIHIYIYYIYPLNISMTYGRPEILCESTNVQFLPVPLEKIFNLKNLQKYWWKKSCTTWDV